MFNYVTSCLRLAEFKVYRNSLIGDDDVDKQEDFMAQEYKQVRGYVQELRDLNFNRNEHSQPLGKGVIAYRDLDFESLINMRFAHQTRQAVTGVRTKHSQMLDAVRKPETLRK